MIAAVLVTALIVVVLVVPHSPPRANREQFEREEDGKWTAAHDCQPDQLALIASPVKKQIRADKCAQSSEQHREEKEARWQSARAAQAAEETADLTYRQGVIGAVDTGILIAAFAASFWAAIGAIRAAQAADRTLEHEQRSAERESRAYVAVAPMGIVKQVGKPLALGQVELRNVGKLPAHRVFLAVHIETGKRDRENFPLDADNPPNRTVQPGATMPQGSKLELSTIERIASTDHVFVWGTAWYDDGVTKDRRFTQFCHRYSAAIYNMAITRAAEFPGSRFVVEVDKARYHVYGNDAD